LTINVGFSRDETVAAEDDDDNDDEDEEEEEDDDDDDDDEGNVEFKVNCFLSTHAALLIAERSCPLA